MQSPSIRYTSRFPDLGFKRRMIAQHKAERKPWPTVLLNAQQASAEYRPNMEAPLSLYLVLSGEMELASTGRRHLLRPGMMAWTGPTETYALTIAPEQRTETFNIHFSETLTEQVLHHALHRPEVLLEGGFATPAFDFQPSTHLMPLHDELFADILRLRNSLQAGTLDGLGQEAAAAYLLQRFTGTQLTELQLAERLQAARPATRSELALRLAQARDYAMSHLTDEIHLEELASAASLSKFHFLRLFTAQYGEPPHRFVLRQRLRLATALLRTTRREVADVALQAGFADAAAFCRTFKRQLGTTPMKYRTQV